MNVKNLIEELKKMPQDFEVVFEHPEFGEYAEITGAHIIDINGGCNGDFCDDVCIKCDAFKKEDNAVELYW